MMFPLWTMFTLFRLNWIAYLMAARTRRSVPSREMTLMPTPELSGKRMFFTFISVWSQAITFFASGVPSAHSMPA